MKQKHTYLIQPDAPLPDTNAEVVGNKAWNLMRMAAAGLPVPAGFVLPAAWCKERRAGRSKASENSLAEALRCGIAKLETETGLRFGSGRRPLLVSVRSGSAVSMPGMMRTILDVGLNLETIEGLISMTGNPRLAWDSYRRFIQGYAETVHQVSSVPFDELVETALASAEAQTVHELDFRALRRLAESMLDFFQKFTGSAFPSDPNEQLLHAADAVFRSWDSPPAVAYRKMNGIDERTGTAATVQRMVLGNAGGTSGSGVGFTRNPSTGDHELYLDFAWNGQGEDVVAGRTTIQDSERLRRLVPDTWKQIVSIANTLEEMFRDAQDFEFTIENGTLYLLQTRSAKRTPWAALRIAVDLVNEKAIKPSEALSRIACFDLASVRRTRISGGGEPLGRAQTASMGIATGAIALDSESAKRISQNSHSVILIRRDTATEDIEGISCAAGILTATGGRTSHAALVARQLGKVCVVSCRDLTIDLTHRQCRIAGRTFQEGEVVSLDGNEGCVYAGAVEVVTERPERELAAIASWHASQKNCLDTEHRTQRCAQNRVRVHGQRNRVVGNRAPSDHH